MDVAHITGFHEQFNHASNNRKPDKEETVIIMAALLGMGLNIGLSKIRSIKVFCSKGRRKNHNKKAAVMAAFLIVDLVMDISRVFVPSCA